MILSPSLGIRLYSIEIYPFLEYPIKNGEKQQHFCYCFSPFYCSIYFEIYFEGCIVPLLSATIFGCIFSLVKSLAIIAFMLKSLYHIHCIKEFFTACINNCTYQFLVFWSFFIHFL